ncbi:YcnI family copper-binding membrane protein [Leucobacter sp. USHLN153]|uniref:YcnI family copper-binding membrane protein n=1 Tax=Leucobacter sp. USHLN153 TaxID=3081268 RepID=UPI003018ABA5
MFITRTHRAAVGVAIGAVLAIGAPVAASAHVTVSPDQAEAGGWAYLTFRAPTESDTASTTKLEFHLPEDTPFTHVSYQPVPGWSADVTEEKLAEPVDVLGNTISEAPTEVTYTADDGGIAPGQVQMFTLSVGPVAETGHIVIPVTQTYSDGTVVEWKATPEQIAEDDTLEPAPVLWVNDAPPADDHHGSSDADHASGGDVGAEAAGAEAASSSSPTSGVTLGLSIAALVIAAGSAVLGALAFARSRKPTA